jgi:hypothetical protein
VNAGRSLLIEPALIALSSLEEDPSIRCRRPQARGESVLEGSGRRFASSRLIRRTPRERRRSQEPFRVSTCYMFSPIP